MKAAELGEPALAPPVPLEGCDRAVIGSALASPRAGFGPFQRYPSLEAKAAVLLYSLSKSQACIDGNKRVALILVKTFLRQNDRDFRAQPGDIADLILYAAESEPGNREDVIEYVTRQMRTIMIRLEEVPE